MRQTIAHGTDRRVTGPDHGRVAVTVPFSDSETLCESVLGSIAALPSEPWTFRRQRPSHGHSETEGGNR